MTRTCVLPYGCMAMIVEEDGDRSAAPAPPIVPPILDDDRPLTAADMPWGEHLWLGCPCDACVRERGEHGVPEPPR